MAEQRGAGWGGRRPGAGRKPRQESGVTHQRREETDADLAVHASLRVLDTVYNLRAKRCFRVIEKALAAWKERDGFRVVHFSVMGNHVHLVAEAESPRVLSRAMQGIAIRIAKGLNLVMKRRGKVFADRFFSRVVRSARDMRNVLAYVLNNARRHCLVDDVKDDWVDEFSSAHAFDGWTIPVSSRARASPPVVPGQSHMMRTWKRACGAIAPSFTPGPRVIAEHPFAG